jgi:hypothetical protein
MKRAFLIAAMLALVSPPAFSQNAPSDGKDAGASRIDRDVDDILRDIRESGRSGFRRGGASFFLRSGDSVIAVRCDPQDTMKACVEATQTLMERAKAAQTARP